MNACVTGAIIRRLREERGLTQAQLAEALMVSDKAVSKWETGKGCPDISLLEPIARVFDVSVAELLSGSAVCNLNRSANLLRSQFYVCPVCGNVLYGLGEAAIHCHGVMLAPCEAEAPDAGHQARVTEVEDEYFVEIDHAMTRAHHISFIAALSPFVPVEAVGVFRYRSPAPGKNFTATESQRRILELVRRRPATLPDLALALELPESISE